MTDWLLFLNISDIAVSSYVSSYVFFFSRSYAMFFVLSEAEKVTTTFSVLLATSM